MRRPPLLAGLAWVVAALVARGDEVDPAAVVATIDGRPVDASRFAAFVLAEKARSGGGADALDQLVQERLVEIEARRRGVRVTEADVDARIGQIDRGLREPSQGGVGLDDHLARLRIDRVQFRALMRKSIACERMMADDFGLRAGAPVPSEKQSLWFQELKARARVRTEGLPEGVAAEYDDGRISRVEWALKLFAALPREEGDRLFDDFVGVELLLAEGRARGIEVTPELVTREIDERSRLLREKLAVEGLVADGVDYLGTLRARGEDPDLVVRGDRFRAEILLKELTRARHGGDGFRAFYDVRRAEFDQAFGRRVRLATLFLKAAQQRSAKAGRTWAEASAELDAMRLRVEAAAPSRAEAFSSLAKLHSEHPSAARGGDLGVLSRAGLEQHGFPAGMLDVPPGTLAGPIVTAEGVHLLQVREALPAAPFQEIALEVEKAARREILRELRRDRKVERKI